MAETARPNMIFQRMDQTGDTTHVAASLGLDTVNSVLIIFNDQTNPQGVNLLKDYYSRATDDPNRVYTIGMNGEANVKELLMSDARYMLEWNKFAESAQEANEKPALNKLRIALKEKPVLLPGEIEASHDMTFIKRLNQIMQYQNGISAYEVRYVGFTTFDVKDKFMIAIRKNELPRLYHDIASRTSGATEYKIAELFKDERFAVAPAHWFETGVAALGAVFWLQQTWGGHNPDGDSDVRGQAQLIHLLEGRFNIITVGHDPVTGRADSPTDADINSSHSKCHLGEFYLKDPLAGKGRGEQVSFLLALMKRYPGNLFQLGQKTGAMDAGALVGIPTLYIEHESSPTFKRMLPWVETIPFYRCAKIQKAPTVQNTISSFGDLATKYMEQQFKTVKSQDSSALTALLKLSGEEQKTLAKILKLKSLVSLSTPSLLEEFKKFNKGDVAGNTKMIADLALQWPDSDIIKGYNLTDQKVIGQNMDALMGDYYSGKAVVIEPKSGYNYHWR